MPGPSSSSITSESGWSNDPNFWVVIGADDSNSAANNGEVSGVETIHLKMSQESSVAKSDSGWINTSCLNGQGAASAECSGRQVTYDMSSVGSGVAYAFYYATDVAGNEPSESELLPSIIYDISFQFDFDAPHGDLAPVIGNIGSSGYLESSTAELSWNAASDEQIGIDVSGIEGYAVAVNDLPTSPLSDVNHPETWDEVNGFQDGTNRICVSAIDVAGNNGSWHCTADFEYDAAQFDTDDDGFSDADDNCPTAPNPNQVDSDEDGIGDACEADSDYDGIIDDEDNCVNEQNVDQSDFNSDGIGDACSDIDEDGVSDADDNCRQDGNADQLDGDGDGIGDICDDSDDDGAMDAVDNCPYHPNSSQEDEDSDGVGDACEGAPADGDGDGVPDIDDNCPSTPNSNQKDTDSDGVGDACDSVSGGSSGGNSAPAAVDIKNPSPNSFYSQSELSQLSLEWWSATDDIEVVGYRIQFDELGWRNVSQSQLSYPFPLLEDDAQHRVQIYAVDADGLSGPTSSVTFSICPDEASANDDHTGCQSSSGHASTIGWNLETLMGGGILILLGVMIYLWGMRRR
ncbi:MAG: hypothetical protein HOE69_02330 [Euryarchaeota archaeon]|nr:hypothetical protein [Euryarchaeota archaeon]